MSPATPLAAIVLAGVVLTGCSVLQNDPLADPVVVCQTRASTINVLSSLNESEQLGEGVLERIDDLITATSPLCTADNEPATNAAALTHLIDGVRELVVIRLSVQ